MKNVFALITLFIAVSINGYSQANATEQVFNVKKTSAPASATFTYKGKPVSPEALLPFLLIDWEQGGILPITAINLKDSTYKWPVDSLSPTRFRVHIVHENILAGTTYAVEEYISYEIIGKTDDNKFVLDVRENGGGSLTYPYLFVFKIVGDELIKVAMFDAEAAYLQPVKVFLQGNKILSGSNVYTIPD